MRNLIWTGVALVLVFGAGFFMVARHAARHPTSFVARCSVAIYRICDALLAPGEFKPPSEIVRAPEAPATVIPMPDVVEPIVVEPTDQEPPLAIPRLSPEIVAAIERLRGEEDSEAPPQAFDGPNLALRMPYADEDVELLPPPSPDVGTDQVEVDIQAAQNGCLLFLPQGCWQTVLDRVVETFRQFGRQTNEGSAVDDVSEK